MLLESYFQLGRIEDCKETVAAWAQVLPNSSEPFRAGAVVMGKAGDVQEAEYMFRKAWALTPRDAGALSLDYAEYLADRGRIVMARRAVDGLKPSTPNQAARLNELKLRIGKTGVGAALPDTASDGLGGLAS
jgi:Flp pilus assembly protein TadD